MTMTRHGMCETQGGHGMVKDSDAWVKKAPHAPFPKPCLRRRPMSDHASDDQYYWVCYAADDDPSRLLLPPARTPRDAYFAWYAKRAQARPITWSEFFWPAPRCFPAINFPDE